jgi:hypothetical protein
VVDVEALLRTDINRVRPVGRWVELFQTSNNACCS